MLHVPKCIEYPCFRYDAAYLCHSLDWKSEMKRSKRPSRPSLDHLQILLAEQAHPQSPDALLPWAGVVTWHSQLYYMIGLANQITVNRRGSSGTEVESDWSISGSLLGVAMARVFSVEVYNYSGTRRGWLLVCTVGATETVVNTAGPVLGLWVQFYCCPDVFWRRTFSQEPGKINCFNKMVKRKVHVYVMTLRKLLLPALTRWLNSTHSIGLISRISLFKKEVLGTL